MSHLQQAIREEAQIQEPNYTLGDLNRYHHACVVANALNPSNTDEQGVMAVTTGHLQYVRDKGIRKVQEATCSLCVIDLLNDGKWHDPKLMTLPN